MQFIDLSAQQKLIRNNINKRIEAVLDHGQYIMGPEVQQLESELAAFCGTKHAISCANGTDALLMPLMTLELTNLDAIFVPAFTFAATAEAVVLAGATPVFVDVAADSFNMDPASLKDAISTAKGMGMKPTAVIPVGLFGRPAAHNQIETIAEADNLFILDDAAQSFGSRYQNRNSGTLGHATATSFFPAKPLGCYGDGGAIFTDDDELADKIKSLRVHGKGQDKYTNVRVGLNSRLDTIQAAILLEKLSIFPNEIENREKHAIHYNSLLTGHVITPSLQVDSSSTWAQYTILSERRDLIAKILKGQNIPTNIYYPLPLHKQIAYDKYPCASMGLSVSERLSSQALSLPLHPYLDDETIETVSHAVIQSLSGQ